MGNIIEFANKLDIDPTELPDTVTTLDSLMAWYNNRTSTPVTIPTDVGTSFISITNSQKVQGIRSNIESRITEANDLHRRAHTRLLEASELRATLMHELLERNKDVTSELNKILIDGWWEYRSYDKYTNGISFATPEITLTHGEKLKVDMGAYKVIIYPDKIAVTSFNNNIFANGYVHPHISSPGSVCWGTAHEIYTKGMVNCEYNRVMTALRAILTQYNPDSPYVELYKFAIKRGVFNLEDYTFEYEESEERSEQFLADELPDDIAWGTVNGTDNWTDKDDEDDESYEEYQEVTLYHRYYRELDYTDDNTAYYKTNTGGFKVWDY